jgi:uncharacterized membrane protein SirB2
VISVYLIVYYTHVSCVSLSGSLFFLRGVWMMQENELLNHRLVRILPHFIDSLLLASAFVLAFQVNQYPFVDGWVTVKFVALILYILLGMFSLRRGKSKSQRTVFFIAAMTTFGFIISVALTRNPVGFLAYFL